MNVIGGGESAGAKKPLAASSSTSCSSSTSDGDEFPRSVAKAVVTQICESVGFHSIHRSALDALADIAIRFLCDIGKASHYYSNMAGRTQSNALDVILALEDMRVLGGGPAESHKSASSSGTLKEVMRFVQYSEEMPFAKPLPHFPVSKKRLMAPSFVQLGEMPPHSHIPPWLPAFPDSHTYKFTPVWNERTSDPRMDKVEQAKQRRKAERSLVSLHLRLSSHGASESSSLVGFNQPSTSAISGPVQAEQDVAHVKGKTKRQSTATQNPFLLSPLPAEAKDDTGLDNYSRPRQDLVINKVHEGKVALPSVLEAFAPALEAVRNSFEQPFQNSSGSQSSSLPDARIRPPVLLKFDFGRKASHKGLAANLTVGGHHDPPTGKEIKRPSFHIKEDEKDEKKKRAGQILKQVLEETEEIAQ